MSAFFHLKTSKKEDSSRWLPHSFSPSLASSAAVAGGGKDLPAILCKLAREGFYLHGPAGCGKTHLARIVCSMLKQSCDFVVSVDVESLVRSLGTNLSFEGLAEHLVKEGELQYEEQAIFLQLLREGSEKIALMCDNFPCTAIGEIVRQRIELERPEIEDDRTDEGRVRSQLQAERKVTKHEELERIVSGNTDRILELLQGPGPRIMVGRVPHPYLCTHSIELGGFGTPATVIQFIQHQLSTVHKVSTSQPLELYLNMRPVLKSLCTLPKMAAMLCAAYAEDNKCIKETETMLVHKMILGWVKTELPEFKEKSLYTLPHEEKEHFSQICRLAFEGLIHGNGTADKESCLLDESEVNAINLQKGYASLDDVQSFGLILSNGNSLLGFAHSLVQEFLAAFHISCLPQNKQILFYCEFFPGKARSFLNLFLFHFGLTRLETEEYLNPSKMVLPAMVESLAHVAEKTLDDSYVDVQKLIVGCLYEAQDSTLVKNFTQQYAPLLDICFPNVRELDDARLTTQLLYVLLQSGINDWEIVIPNENARGKTDSIIFPLSMRQDTSVKVEVIVQHSHGQSFTLRAVYEPRTPQKSGQATEMMKRAKNEVEKEQYFKLAMQCVGQAETLHSVTQLYSPIQVRSDATDPAYASLITCSCAGKTLQSDVIFEPVQPIHIVQLGSRSKKAKAAEVERDATAKTHMIHKHQNSYTEIIVLNKPSVKSITFQPPGASGQCRVVVSEEKSSPSASGRIAMESQSMLEDSVNWTECVAVSESSQVKVSKMVPHSLPLPKKTKVEADKRNAGEPAEVSGMRNDVGVTATPAQVAPSHKFFQEDDLAPDSPIPVQAESLEKMTWRPGMIMHSTIPDVFQKHKTYSMPEETNQIRRGGNGEIFATEYFSYVMVAKKTLFRNREFNIILRLNHANIVPLLAVMVGEVFHKRRFYCYHLLPRMSGDAARMLSDHPELTLAAIRETNSDDPRKFGLALGNLRYFLAEVLKGLAYMHSLHILHRDVKSSNILIRFHCNHNNLIWCTCTHKYTVCVCDFDAAVEMDENDRMLPVSSTSQVFYLPPVGTQGFRSPESSQLVIANSREAIAPQLTPATDIWSYGILMLRLFLGEEGPGSQRLNSILLLKYHQSRHMTEGRLKGFQRELVSDKLVDKILKFPQLKAKLSGVKNLVDFVTRCLRLDPQKRPSAKELLNHSFLY